MQTRGGLWARDGNTFFQIKKVLTTGIADDVTLYRLDDNFRVNEILVARHAVYQGNVWQLMDVLTTRFSEGAIKTDHTDAMAWNSSLTPDVVGLVSIPPENLSIWDLSGYIGYLRENGLDSGPYEAPLIAGGVRCHGGFDAAGAYRSPRTLHRAPAVAAWQARLAREGSPLVEVPRALMPHAIPERGAGEAARGSRPWR